MTATLLILGLFLGHLLVLLAYGASTLFSWIEDRFGLWPILAALIALISLN